MKTCFLKNFSSNHETKIYSLFLFDYNDVRGFEVFEWTAGCIFKCETRNMKLAKNIKK